MGAHGGEPGWGALLANAVARVSERRVRSPRLEQSVSETMTTVAVWACGPPQHTSRASSGNHSVVRNRRLRARIAGPVVPRDCTRSRVQNGPGKVAGVVNGYSLATPTDPPVPRFGNSSDLLSLARPAVTRLLADVDAGRLDTIVVYKVDRLTRSLADFARIVERLDAAGVSFVDHPAVQYDEFDGAAHPQCVAVLCAV